MLLRKHQRVLCVGITLTLAVCGGYQLWQASWIMAKAQVAQVLISRAWHHNQKAGKAVTKPWSWADTSPVARLKFVRQQADMVVLSGDSGRVLAFGPGHDPNTPLPGNGGNSVISGHRDTHFSLLRDVKPGDLVSVQTIGGETVHYAIDSTQVVDQSQVEVTYDNGLDELTLVTCWPFNALTPQGPKRFVVSARRAFPKLVHQF
jgi:sortase A